MAEPRRLLRLETAAVTAAILAVLIALALPAEAARLHDQTIADWERYVAATEARIATELDEGPFLVQENLLSADGDRCRLEVTGGLVCVVELRTRDEDGEQLGAHKGLIHHWLGSIFVPDIDVDTLIAWVQRYDDHERWFDEVERSRLIDNAGDAYTIGLQLKRKKVVTVRYDTEHAVLYRDHGAGRVSSRSVATRIAELAGEDLSTGTKPTGEDRGFLWRLNTYWRYREVDGGVVVECESLSLSRGIPRAVGWLVRPFVRSVPRESLESTLFSIRNGVTTPRS